MRNKRGACVGRPFFLHRGQETSYFAGKAYVFVMKQGRLIAIHSEILKAPEQVPFDSDYNLLSNPEGEVIAMVNDETGEILFPGTDYHIVSAHGVYRRFRNEHVAAALEKASPIRTPPDKWEEAHTFLATLKVHGTRGSSAVKGEATVVLKDQRGHLLPMFYQHYDAIYERAQANNGEVRGEWGYVRENGFYGIMFLNER